MEEGIGTGRVWGYSGIWQVLHVVTFGTVGLTLPHLICRAHWRRGKIQESVTEFQLTTVRAIMLVLFQICGTGGVAGRLYTRHRENSGGRVASPLKERFA